MNKKLIPGKLYRTTYDGSDWWYPLGTPLLYLGIANEEDENEDYEDGVACGGTLFLTPDGTVDKYSRWARISTHPSLYLDGPWLILDDDGEEV